MPFQGVQKPLEETAESPEQRTSFIPGIFQYSKARRAWEVVGCLTIELGAISYLFHLGIEIHAQRLSVKSVAFLA